MTRTILASRRVDTAYVYGTEWPVTDEMARESRNGRVEWVLTYAICNGVAAGAKVYRTRKEAFGAWESYAKEVGAS